MLRGRASCLQAKRIAGAVAAHWRIAIPKKKTPAKARVLKCRPQAESVDLCAQFPALPVFALYELVGFVEIGDLHVHRIQEKLFPDGVTAARILEVIGRRR